jgi:predicted HTH transcriptional regulator
VDATINKTQQHIVVLLVKNGNLTSKKITHILNLTDNAVKHNIKTLKENGSIERMGTSKKVVK